MKTAFRLLCVSSLFALAVVRAEEPVKAVDIVEKLGGSRIVEIVQTAHTITVGRLAPQVLSRSEFSDLRKRAKSESASSETARARVLAARFAPVDAGMALDAANGAALKEMLLSLQTYSPPTGLLKGCEFYPVIRAGFASKTGQVEVWFCFGCHDLLVMSEGKVVGGGEFKPGRIILLNFFKAVLKDDAFIAKLY